MHLHDLKEVVDTSWSVYQYIYQGPSCKCIHHWSLRVFEKTCGPHLSMFNSRLKIHKEQKTTHFVFPNEFHSVVSNGITVAPPTKHHMFCWIRWPWLKPKGRIPQEKIDQINHKRRQQRQSSGFNKPVVYLIEGGDSGLLLNRTPQINTIKQQKLIHPEFAIATVNPCFSTDCQGQGLFLLLRFGPVKVGRVAR